LSHSRPPPSGGGFRLQAQRRSGFVLTGDCNGDVAGSDLAEFFSDSLLCQLRTVTVTAKVREKNVAEFVAGDFAGQNGCGVIAEMTVPAHDPLFGGPRACSVFLQQLQIVIRFQHQCVHGTHAFRDQLRDVAEIGQDTHRDAGASVPDDETDRILGIVRYAEGFNEQIADFKGRARGKQPPGDADAVWLFGIGGDGFSGETVSVDGNRPRLAKSAETTSMVAVFVGEDDAIDLFEIAADEREPLRDLATTQARINKESRRVGFNQCAIAGAATPQDRDLHPHDGDSTRSGDGLKLSA
jgi:hypothetical protein